MSRMLANPPMNVCDGPRVPVPGEQDARRFPQVTWKVGRDGPITSRYDKVYRVYPTGLDHLVCTRYWWAGGCTTNVYDPRQRRVIVNLQCPGAQWADVSTARWRTMEMSLIRKSLERSSKSATSDKCLDAAFMKKFPAIAEFLTTTSLEGQPRQTATVSVWWTPHGFTAVMNDRETGHSLFANADRFEGLWEALETALKSPDPGWRAKDAAGTSKRVKRG